MPRLRTLILATAVAATLATSVAAAEAPATVVRDGVTFGAVEPLAGVYFTNFENSVLTLCDPDKAECREGKAPAPRHAVLCEPAACADLEARIQTLNGSHDTWGRFALRLTGRRSTAPGKSDPGDKILAERIESVVLIERR